MKFKIYTGSYASNESVNLSCRGTFEAKSVTDAIKKIEYTKKFRYCEEWQVADKTNYIPELVEALKWGAFVCCGEPIPSNVIWKESKAIISYFDRN